MVKLRTIIVIPQARIRKNDQTDMLGLAFTSASLLQRDVLGKNVKEIIRRLKGRLKRQTQKYFCDDRQCCQLLEYHRPVL